MNLKWIAEKPAHWNPDKARIVGATPQGVFDRRYESCRDGETMPGEWWRAESDGKTLGFGWLENVWGDAEILLATDPECRGQGVGTFILENLEREAKKRGLNYVYNTVRPNHPDRANVAAWLEQRGFKASEDGSLFRAVTSG